MQPAFDKVQRYAVVGCNARRHTLTDEAMISWPTGWFAVVMRTVASGEKTQAIERSQLIAEGIRNSGFKPTDRARAYAGKGVARYAW